MGMPPGSNAGPMPPRGMAPPMGNALRLNIPPNQGMMPPQPGTPNSGQPSPALTPRSESGDGDSSRGATPGPDGVFDSSGATTPD